LDGRGPHHSPRLGEVDRSELGHRQRLQGLLPFNVQGHLCRLKFKVDATFAKVARNLNTPGGAYVITAATPDRNGEFEYRLRNTREPHEGVMAESQLSATP
jgi:hypothetical protein